MKTDTVPDGESNARHENRHQNKHEIKLTELFHEIQPPSNLERLIVGTLEFAEHFFGNAIPEIFPNLCALWAVDVMSQDVVDKVRRHVSRRGVVRPLSWVMTLRKPVPPVIFDRDQVTVVNLELFKRLLALERASQTNFKGLTSKYSTLTSVRRVNIRLQKGFQS